MRELRGEPEAGFDELLAEAGVCDLVVIEGFKDLSFPKLEIRRDGAASREPLARQISHVVAIASDRPQDEKDDLPIFQIDDVPGITDFVITHLRLAPTS